MSAPLHVVILAAGEGKRMKSALPKVLQSIAGRPMLAHVIDTARALQPDGIHIVHGHGGDQVRAAFAAQGDLHWAEQATQLGTGHAVQQAMPDVADDARTAVHRCKPALPGSPMSRHPRTPYSSITQAPAAAGS